MKKAICSVSMTAALAVMVFAPASSEAAIDWTGNGSDDNYATPENWEGNTVPGVGDRVWPTTGTGKMVVDGNFPLNSDPANPDDNRFDHFHMGRTSDGSARVEADILDGAFITSNSGGLYAPDGIVNQTGGEFQARDGWFSLRGTWNLSGGHIERHRGVALPVEGLLHVSGTGTARGRPGLTVAEGGELRMSGSEIRVWANNSTDLSGTTRFDIDDTATGINPLEISGNSLSFGANAEIGLSFLDWTGPAQETTWTIIEDYGSVSGFSDVSLTGVDESMWSLTNDTTNNQITATYVPEPSSLVLLGIAGLLLMKRRRV